MDDVPPTELRGGVSRRSTSRDGDTGAKTSDKQHAEDRWSALVDDVEALLADVRSTTDIPVDFALGDISTYPASGKRHRLAGETVDFRLVKVALGRDTVVKEFAEDNDREMTRFVLGEAIQDVLIDQFGAAWPPCPAHDHPLWAALRDDEAVWRCPSGDVAIAMGALQPPA